MFEISFLVEELFSMMVEEGVEDIFVLHVEVCRFASHGGVDQLHLHELLEYFVCMGSFHLGDFADA